MLPMKNSNFSGTSLFPVSAFINFVKSVSTLRSLKVIWTDFPNVLKTLGSNKHFFASIISRDPGKSPYKLSNHSLKCFFSFQPAYILTN